MGAGSPFAVAIMLVLLASAALVAMPALHLELPEVTTATAAPVCNAPCATDSPPAPDPEALTFAGPPPPWAPTDWAPLTSPPDEEANEGNNRNDCEDLYALGDSYTAALPATYDGLLPLGGSSYVYQYRHMYAPHLRVDHNLDGNGQGTTWAKANAEASLPPPGCTGQTWLLEFGANDMRAKRGNLTASEIARGLGTLVDATLERGAKVVWFELIPLPDDCPVWGDEGVYHPASRQMEIVEAIRKEALRRDLMSFPAWDATDAIPGDGIRQTLDPKFAYDCVHPDDAAYKQIAAWLNQFLEGGLHSVTTDRAGQLQVQVNYTRTLILPLGDIPKERAIVYDKVEQRFVATEPGVGPYIRFGGVAGHNYVVGQGAIVEVKE